VDTRALELGFGLAALPRADLPAIDRRIAARV
jgi:hypothetical protein